MARRQPIMTFLITLTLLTVPAATVIHASAEIDLLAKYFDLLASGNYESAAYLWDEQSLDRASRFGIEYTDIPIKVDCGSPIVRNLAIMRNFLQPPARLSERLVPADFMRLEYSQVISAVEVKHNYFVRNDGGYYWLIYPQDYYCRDYRVVTSKYFKIHASPEMHQYLNGAVLAEADRFVDRVADSLKLNSGQKSAIEVNKIEYYYVPSDSMVRVITGFPVQGTYDLASDDVISASFPHFHEICHFLVQYKLRTLPLYTLPIFREGIAVRYGGRWGKAPAPLDDLGKFLIDNQIAEIDSIITMSGFESMSGSDIAYPLAGTFCAYMLDRLGNEQFWNLYLACSGNIDSLNAMSPEAVQSIIMRAAGDSTWLAVTSGFMNYLNQLSERRYLLPGVLENSKQVASLGAATISAAGDWICVEFAGTDSASFNYSLLFGKDKSMAKGKSSLFKTQFGEAVPFDGYRWSLRVDKNEAGIYDYAGNQLTAKYIYAMTPDPAYLAEDGNTVRVRFHRNLVGGTVPVASDMKCLNQ